MLALVEVLLHAPHDNINWLPSSLHTAELLQVIHFSVFSHCMATLSPLLMCSLYQILIVHPANAGTCFELLAAHGLNSFSAVHESQVSVPVSPSLSSSKFILKIPFFFYFFAFAQALASAMERINVTLQPAQGSALRLSTFRSIRAPP